MKNLQIHVAQAITHKRRNFKKPMGSRKWWKDINNKSKRSSSSPRVTLNEISLTRFNQFFSEVFQDEYNVEPTPLIVDTTMKTPQVTEMQVQNSLGKRQSRVLMVYHFGFGKIMEKYLQKLSLRFGTFRYELKLGQ